MKNTKNYTIVHNSELILFTANKGGETSTPETNTIFESDSLQECIDYLLSKTIESFPIPLILYGTEIENIKKNPVFSNNILTRYESGKPVYENNVLVGWIEETDQDIILQRKIKSLEWKYPDMEKVPKRSIRVSGDVELFFTGGDYAAFMNQIIIRGTPIVPVSDNISYIYFEWLEVGLFQLINDLITCIDPQIKVEQLYETGYQQSATRIYRV